MKLSNITTQYRGKLILDTYKKWLKPGDNVLDVGCGNGVISDILQKSFQLNLTGCDIASYLTRKIKFVRMKSKTKLPFKDGQFDVAIFTDALHHVEFDYQILLLKEALRVATNIIIFELNPTFTTRLFDWSINMLHYRKMQIPFTYRTKKKWGNLFSQLKIKSYRVEVPTPWFYPFSHQAYYLNKFNLPSRKKNHP